MPRSTKSRVPEIKRPAPKPAAQERQLTSEELRSENRKFAGTIKSGAFKPEELAGIRKRYLEQLKHIPFFRELLSKQKKIKISVAGKDYHFTILTTGLAMERFSRPIVVVLNGYGQKVLFYKSTGINSKMPGKWLPFNSMKFIESPKDGNYWWYEKFEGHPRFTEQYRKVSEEIGKIENQLELKKHWNMDQVAAINEYL